MFEEIPTFVFEERPPFVFEERPTFVFKGRPTFVFQGFEERLAGMFVWVSTANEQKNL